MLLAKIKMSANNDHNNFPSKRVLLSMNDTSDFLKKPDKSIRSSSDKSKTLRIDLDLFEPDEYKFPEFNFKNLIHFEKVNLFLLFFLLLRLRKRKIFQIFSVLVFRRNKRRFLNCRMETTRPLS